MDWVRSKNMIFDRTRGIHIMAKEEFWGKPKEVAQSMRANGNTEDPEYRKTWAVSKDDEEMDFHIKFWLGIAGDDLCIEEENTGQRTSLRVLKKQSKQQEDEIERLKKQIQTISEESKSKMSSTPLSVIDLSANTSSQEKKEILDKNEL
jgi:hypothetical protein